MNVVGIRRMATSSPHSVFTKQLGEKNPFFNFTDCRVAKLFTTSNPILCRVCSYSRPGLPNPTTSFKIIYPLYSSLGFSVITSGSAATSPSSSSSCSTFGAETPATTASASLKIATLLPSFKSDT